MNTYEIVESTLEKYKTGKLKDERIQFLLKQVEEQLEEIQQNNTFYINILNEINAPKSIHNVILWMLLMSNEDIVEKYIETFNKNFMDIIPVSDLADLLFYLVYQKKIHNITLDGFDYLLSSKEEGIDDMDQYCFTNILGYIQTMKKFEVEF